MQSTQSDLTTDLEAVLDAAVPCGVNHDWPDVPACSLDVVALLTFRCEPIELFACQSAVDFIRSIESEVCANGGCELTIANCWNPRAI